MRAFLGRLTNLFYFPGRGVQWETSVVLSTINKEIKKPQPKLKVPRPENSLSPRQTGAVRHPVATLLQEIWTPLRSFKQWGGTGTGRYLADRVHLSLLFIPQCPFFSSATKIEPVDETWLPTKRLPFQASFANNSGHETKFWTTECELKLFTALDYNLKRQSPWEWVQAPEKKCEEG